MPQAIQRPALEARKRLSWSTPQAASTAAPSPKMESAMEGVRAFSTNGTKAYRIPWNTLWNPSA